MFIKFLFIHILLFFTYWKKNSGMFQSDPEKLIQESIALESVITDEILHNLGSKTYQSERIKSVTSEENLKDPVQVKWEVERLTTENSRLEKRVLELEENIKVKDMSYAKEVERWKVESELKDSVITELQERLQKQMLRKSSKSE
jgi:hypothetical protein